MSVSRTKGLVLGIACLVVIYLCVWIVGLYRDASSTNKFHVGFVPDASFSGQLVVTIIERKTGPERNLEFLIDLDHGGISMSPDLHRHSHMLSLGGRLDDRDCENMVQIPAPDHESAAYCKVAGNRYIVGVQNVGSQGHAREWTAGEGWAISGLIWSPGAKSVAVLLGRERTDLDPIGLVSLLSGHPIPLTTLKVVLLSNRLDHQVELPVIRKDSPSAWARIDWIR